jgi:hypothetical protein
MKKAKALILSTVFLLAGQASAYAQQQLPSLTPAQTQRLSRDLVPFNSQNFFNQGRDLIEREIQMLMRRQSSLNKPVLKLNLDAAGKKRPPTNTVPL